MSKDKTWKNDKGHTVVPVEIDIEDDFDGCSLSIALAKTEGIELEFVHSVLLCIHNKYVDSIGHPELKR